MKSPFTFLVFLSMIIVVSCKTKEQPKDIFTPGFSTLRDDSTSTDQPVIKEETYYGVLTPVEIC